MKNENIIKNILPQLRLDEEILYIVEKCKWNFLFHISTLLFLLIVLGIFLYKNVENFPLEDIILFSMFLLVFPFMIITAVITYKTNFIVITNQRVICSRYWKITFFERDNIKKVHYSYQNDKRCISTVLIETKDSKPYIIEYFDYKKIKEKLGL